MLLDFLIPVPDTAKPVTIKSNINFIYTIHSVEKEF